jgi:syntaxin-binding protein 5
MAGFLRSRQAGVQNDLSAGIAPGMFTPEKGVRYGINSQIRYEAFIVQHTTTN